jgi:hypothetical protein
MKRVYLVSLLLLLVPGIGTLDAGKTHTGKTFLLHQPFRSPTDYTFYDYARTILIKQKNLWGGHLQATYFYRRDENRKSVGKYFGRNGRNVISIGSGKTDFQSANLVFTNTPSTLNFSGDLEINPYRSVKGVNISYLQKVTKSSDRLFIGVRVPWIRITRRMKTRVHGIEEEDVEGEKLSIYDYFNGYLQQNGSPYKQDPLKYAKIRCCGSDFKTGIGDVEASLSYQFGNSNNYYFRTHADVVFPTSDKPTGETLYEPLIGNGSQWGIGVGFEGMAVLHKDGDLKIKANYGGSAKYFFSNTQKRMVSFRSDDWDSRRSWAGYYSLLGEKGKVGVFPAANILTRDVKVLQGILVDCFVNCTLSWRGFLLQAGYNFLSRGAESVSVKNWSNDKYALASPAYDASTPFTIVANPDPSLDDNLEGPIQRDMLDTEPAETPTSTTHKVYAMISGKWCWESVPVTLGFGGAYEFAQDNAALEGYELFVKLGASF